MEELTLTVVYTSKPGMRQAFVEEVVARGILDKIRARKAASPTITTPPRTTSTASCSSKNGKAPRIRKPTWPSSTCRSLPRSNRASSTAPRSSAIEREKRPSQKFLRWSLF